VLIGLLVASCFVVGSNHGVEAASISPAPCTASAISSAYNSANQVPAGVHALRVQSMGCVGGWAWVVANVGAISSTSYDVTMVWEYNHLVGHWVPLDRLLWCKPGLLANEVYRMGCFSN
jgi:hypothetical protein